MQSNFKFYSKGIVAKDLVLENDSAGMLEVFAEEYHTAKDTVLEDSKSTSEVSTAPTGQLTGGSATSTTNIKAKWLNFGNPNRVTPPNVKKGEAIMIFTFGESDLYYWTTMFTELDIRRKETILTLYVNTDEFGITATKENSHWSLVDIVNKKIMFHTSDNDGEVCTYDFSLDLKNGIVEAKDGNGNYIKHQSKVGKTNVKLKTLILDVDDVTLNGSKFTQNVKNIIANGSKYTFNILTNFLKKVKMNNNAETTVGPHGHTHTII